MLKLINEDCTDLSLEAYCMMGATLYNIGAAETMMYQVSEALDKLGAKHTWFQEKKRYIKDAERHLKSLLADLDIATAEANGRIINNAIKKGDVKWASDTLYEAYQLAAIISIMFFSKTEGDPETARSMVKALGNFKVKTPKMDINGLLQFFHYNTLINKK